MRLLIYTTALALVACDDGAPAPTMDAGPADMADMAVVGDSQAPDMTLEADLGPGVDMTTPPGPPQGRLVLTRGPTVEMPEGTHRPEIEALADGTFVLAVVKPESSPEGRIKHRVYRLAPDLTVLSTFPVARVAAPYGEPADHRITIVDDEIIVVYQTLNYEGGEPPRGGGPSEDFATDQSLMLARFSLDGDELFRGPIVDRADDFSVDNFPDHCLVWWGDRLLVSSGTRARSVHIREVGLDGTVHSDHLYPTGGDGISGSIGNSMHLRSDRVGVFSSNSPAGNGALTLTAVNADFEVSRVAELGGDDGTERHFPTDSQSLGDYTLVTYIGRATGGPRGLEENPYTPRLMVIDADYAIAQDIELGEGGFAHVHPTMTVLGDQLLVAWSKRVGRAPQVQIERFTVSWE